MEYVKVAINIPKPVFDEFVDQAEGKTEEERQLAVLSAIKTAAPGKCQGDVRHKLERAKDLALADDKDEEALALSKKLRLNEQASILSSFDGQKELEAKVEAIQKAREESKKKAEGKKDK